MFQKIQKFISDHQLATSLIVLSLVVFLWLTFRKPIENDSPQPTKGDPEVIPQVYPEKTTVETSPRTSATDNNVELTEVYTAKVNGETVKVPIKPLPDQTGVYGTKGIITQQIDLTPVVEQATLIARKEAQQEFKKNYELGVGLGVHEGDVYIPVEIQRNYDKTHAVSLELHLDPSESKVITGGEIKYKVLIK